MGIFSSLFFPGFRAKGFEVRVPFVAGSCNDDPNILGRVQGLSICFGRFCVGRPVRAERAWRLADINVKHPKQ